MIGFRILLLFCAFLILPVAAQKKAEPVRGFVTLEPFEIRVEALCLPLAYQNEWDLSDSYLYGTQKEVALTNALELLKTRTAITSSNQEFSFDSTHAQFVTYTKDLGYVPDDREEIPIEEAIIGVSMSSRCRAVDHLQITWEWTAPEQKRVPVLLTAGGDHKARYLSEYEPNMSWGRTSGSDEIPKMLSIPPVEMVKRSHQPIWLKVGLGILALAGIIVLILKNRTPTLVFFLIPLGIVALFGAFRFAKSVPVLPESTKASSLVSNLLRNTYHAFDFRDESDIYDTLEESIAGPLLEDMYLEIRKGLELEIRGGPRIRIDTIDLRECKIIARNDDGGTFDVQTEWVALGKVHHWGHSHMRHNRYKAILRVGAIGQTWKVTKMQVLDEERTQQVTTAGAL